MFPRLASLRRPRTTKYQTPAELLAGPSRHGRIAVAVALAAVGGGLAVHNLAGAAAPTTDTTAVDFVTIPAKQTWGGNAINPGATESVVVIGGSTTVPTNATTVRLEVTVTGTAAGTIKLFPAGNPTGGPGHSISWNAAQVVTQVTNEHPGLSNKLSVQNLSTKAAKVTVKITGYSTQVTAGGISPSGGSDGQVLTNNGSGVVWQSPDFQSADTATLTVHPTSDTATNGTRLRDAVAAVPASTRTLIRLEPGTYDLGSTGITVPNNTWIAGSGQGITTITGTAQNLITTSGDAGLDRLTLSGSAGTCVSVPVAGHVTVQLTALNGCSFGVRTTAPATLDVVDTSVSVTNGRGIDMTNGGTLTIAGSTIVDTGGVGSGVALSSAAAAKISDSHITGAIIGLLVVAGSTANVTGSQLAGPSSAINLSNSTGNVANTQVAGGVATNATSTLRCVGAYSASYTALGSGCL